MINTPHEFLHEIDDSDWDDIPALIAARDAAIRAEEREACAKIADRQFGDPAEETDLGRLIRARASSSASGDA